MNFKCKSCGKVEQYLDEKDAYMNGWYMEAMSIGNYVLPKGVKVCHGCAVAGGDHQSQSEIEFVENED